MQVALILFATVVAVSAYPPNYYYNRFQSRSSSESSELEPLGTVLETKEGFPLIPYYEVEPAPTDLGRAYRKYTISKKSDVEDEEEEEDDLQDEEDEEEDEEPSFDTPAWSQMFPNPDNRPVGPGQFQQSYNDIPRPTSGPGASSGPIAFSGGPPQRDQPLRRRPLVRQSQVPPRRSARREGRDTRIITGWSNTPLNDPYNPEYIVNPTAMRLRRKFRYHPSQQIPVQRIPLYSGYWGDPRDSYSDGQGGYWAPSHGLQGPYLEHNYI